jgi:glycosyltransferase involved in cell wall biosynthesis
MNIAVIAPGELPIPSTKGGAIETLVTYLLQMNETLGQINFFVYSYYDIEANATSKRYSYSKFYYINAKSIIAELYDLFSRVKKRIFRDNTVFNNYFLNQAIRNINKQNFDIVLIEGRPDFVIPIKLQISAPIYLHIHTDIFNSNTIDGKKIISLSEKIIANSQFIKSRILTLGEYYEKKVIVLQNAVDVDVFNKKKYIEFNEMFRSKYRISPYEKIIIFCGRFDPSKGVKELVLAFEKLNNKSTRLVIIGSPWFSSNNKNDYVQKVKGLAKNYRDRIIFTGYIDHNDLPKYYSVADIAVFPSLCDEAAGLVIIEALSSGLPVITTITGGIPEYTSEKFGKLIPKDDNLIYNLVNSLEEIIKLDQKSYECLSNDCQNYAKKFNIDIYYKNFRNIIFNSDIYK